MGALAMYAKPEEIHIKAQYTQMFLRGSDRSFWARWLRHQKKHIALCLCFFLSETMYCRVPLWQSHQPSSHLLAEKKDRSQCRTRICSGPQRHGAPLPRPVLVHGLKERGQEEDLGVHSSVAKVREQAQLSKWFICH